MQPQSLNYSHLCIKPTDINTVIYHHQCTDGYFAKVIAELFAKENGLEFEYIPGIFHSALPNIKNKNVAIFDFSYKKTDMEKLLKEAKNIVVIDHHKTAMEDLQSLPNHNKLFDMNYSGAVLAWHYFYPNKKLPLALEYVQDNDLWKKQLPNTNEFSAKMFSTPFTFEEYSSLLEDQKVNDVIKDGKIILSYQNETVDKILKTASISLMEINSNLHIVSVVNSGILKSELGSKLFDKYPQSDFSVVYHIDDLTSNTIYSLRSTNDRADVGEICKQLGSGGHRNAGGHREKTVMSNIPGTVLCNGSQLVDLLKTVTTQIITINGNKFVSAITKNKICPRLCEYLIKKRNENLQEVQYLLNKSEKYDIACDWYNTGNNTTIYTLAFVNLDKATECYSYLNRNAQNVSINGNVLEITTFGTNKELIF